MKGGAWSQSRVLGDEIGCERGRMFAVLCRQEALQFRWALVSSEVLLIGKSREQAVVAATESVLCAVTV